MSKYFDPAAAEYQSIPPEKFAFVQRDEALLDTAFDTKPIGFFKDAAIRFCKSKVSIAALIGIAVILLLALFGPLANEHGYNDQALDYINLPPKASALQKIGLFDGSRWLSNRRVDSLGNTDKYPEGCILDTRNYVTVKGVELCDVKVDYYKYSGIPEGVEFWMGTDYLGRDVWTRMWRAARISLLIAMVSVACNVCIGLVYGSISGYYGGMVDIVMMRITEIIGSIPEVVIVTLFIMYFGTGIGSIIMALLMKNWIGTARTVRTQFFRYKNREYVLAARSLGVPDRSLIFRHILPNSIGPIITRAMTAIPGAIFTESFLAYIGLGIKAPECSIGVMLAYGQKVLLQYPEQVLFPSIVISVLMISFNLLSNGLRDAFDPTLRGA